MSYKPTKNLVKISFVLFLSIFMFSPKPVIGYNKSWDQGHRPCVAGPGNAGYGYYDYDGVFQSVAASKECCEVLCKICPVYANTGRLQKTFIDLTIPGIGPELKIVRTYNSQEWATSLLGNSWCFNFGKRLIITRNKKNEKILGILLQSGEKNFYKEHSDGTIELLADYGVTYKLQKNQDETYELTNIDGTRYELNSDGKIKKIIDKNGNELFFEYNGVGCLSKITNASGNYVIFQLGPNGKIASVSDNLGRTISYGYDQNGNLISFTDPMGNTTNYNYDSRNRLIQIIDPRGNPIISAAYNNDNKVSTFMEKGETYSITYFTDHTIKTDSSGNSWTYYFNNVGIIEKIIDPSGNTIQQSHNKLTSTSLDWEEDVNGNRTYFTYDSYANIDSITDPLGNIWKYTYIPATDLVVTETDPKDIVTKYEYDSKGRKIKIIKDFGGPLENEILYAYDDKGNLLSQTDPLGNTTNYEYDINGNKIKETDPLGNVTTYTYDNRDNMLTKTDSNGNINTYEYDLMDRLISSKDPLGNTITYTYDANGNKISQTDPKGNKTNYEYDQYNRLTKIIDAMGNVKAKTYNKWGISSNIDENGNVIYYKYDNVGNIIKKVIKIGDTNDSIDSDDIVIQYQYDKMGDLIEEIDPDGGKTTYIYDVLGRKTKVDTPNGDIVNYSYDAVGNLVEIKIGQNDPGIQLTYDRLNRLISYQDGIGQSRTMTYDKAGRKISETDAEGYTTTYKFDALGRQTQIIFPDGKFTEINHDPAGNMISQRGIDGRINSFNHDASGRVISSVDPMGNMISATYDSNGNLTSLTDPKGNTTYYTYDALNQKTKITFSDNLSITYNYDGKGNLISLTDRNGDTTGFVYNEMDLIIKRDFPGDNDDNFSYDKGGRLMSASNLHSAIQFGYNASGRVIKEVQNGKEINYHYDSQNWTRKITYPNGQDIIIKYDDRDRLSIIEDSLGDMIASYNYYSNNKVSEKNYRNGIKASYGFNDKDWISQIKYTLNTTTLFDREYFYGENGKLDHEKSTYDLENSQKYSYDDLNRLINYKLGLADSNGNISSPTEEIDYQMDKLSNWLTFTINDSQEERTVNEINAYTSVGGAAFNYDNNGNLIDDGSKIYEYDYMSRLVRVKDKSTDEVLVEYRYDPLGRRISKISNGTITEYYYDRNFQVIEEHQNGQLLATYIYGLGIDKPLVMQKNGNSYYYICNIRGDIVMLTDNNGNIIESYKYDPYGNVKIYDSSDNLISQSLVGNPYLFVGRRYDEESDLYYFRARYYKPELGRFISQDHLVYTTSIGYTTTMNLYEYALSDPLLKIDPFGLKSCNISTTFELSLDDKIKKLTDKIKLFGLNFTVGGSASLEISHCTEKCCDQSGTLITYPFNEYDFSAGLSLGFSGWVPSMSISLPTGDGIGVKAGISFSVIGGGSYTCEVAMAYCKKTCKGEGCGTFSGSVWLGAGAQIGEDDMGAEIFIKGKGSASGSICANDQGITFQPCLNGSIVVTAKTTLLVFSWGWEWTLLSGQICSGPFTLYSW